MATNRDSAEGTLPELPDYLRQGLVLVSIGLNPSIRSSQTGFYFAHPRNRFWRALTVSRLAPHGVTPGKEAVEHLFSEHGIGFTDIVKRPTRGGAALRAADYREGAAMLKQKLLTYRPAIAWFHGKMAYRYYLAYAEYTRESIPWGEQERLIGQSLVFVTPNPSPANAAFSLADLTEQYRRLKQLCGQTVQTLDTVGETSA